MEVEIDVLCGKCLIVVRATKESFFGIYICPLCNGVVAKTVDKEKV